MSRRRDERGATAVLVAVVTVALVVPLAAFAVDLGMQRVARRDMQAIADAVALDMGRELDGRMRSTIKNAAAWKDAIAGAVERTAGPALGGGDGAVEVDPAQGNDGPATATVAGSPLQVQVRMGRLADDGTFEPAGNTDVPTAVRVVAETHIDYAIAQGQGGAGRSAVAVAQGGACFSIGSWAARLRSGESELGPLLDTLGTQLDLDLIDYQALADAEVTLVDLLGAETSVGTVRELIAGDELITLGEWTAAMASVLPDDAPSEVTTPLAGVTVDDVMVRVSDLIHLGTEGPVGLESSLNVLDLLAAGAMTGTGEHALELEVDQLDLGPLAGLTASAHVTEPPQIGCGLPHRAQASNAQVSVDLAADAADLDLDLLGLDLANVDISLRGAGVDADGNPYALRVAAATGTLADVRCQPHPGIGVDVTGGLVEVDLELRVQTSGLFDIPLLDVTIPVATSMPYEDRVDVTITHDNWDEPATVSGGSFQLDPLLPGSLGSTLSNAVTQIVDRLHQELLNPLLEDLGVAINGADVYALPTPECDVPVLRQ